jgi:hypothetical protein
MNLKTTLVLVVLAVAGVAWVLLAPPLPSWLGVKSPPPETSPAASAAVLEKELTPAALTRIEIRRGDRQTVLEKSSAGDWTIEGKWQTRPREVEELVGLLTSLRSRFAPIAVSGDTDLKAYGLDRSALTIIVQANNKKYRLTLGEDPADSNRFTRATYLRLGEPRDAGFQDRGEILRLAPGLVAALDRPVEYYLKRQLFPSERVAKSADSQEKIDRLAAQEIAAKDAKNAYTLAQSGKEWELKEPVRDRLDPDKLQSILTAVPDIWAEHFVREPNKDLAEYGLDKPEQTITIKRPGGNRVTLLIGKKSPRKVERKVSRPLPGQFGQPPLPMMDKVVEEFYYAKLEGNDQIFEIKADKLKDVFVSADSLRDSKLARFKPDDVQRLELTYKDTTIVLAKKDGKWRLEKPIDTDAESGKVTELIDKLSQLDAKGSDVIDKGDAKEYSLEPPAGTVALTVEEEIKGKGDEKEKKTRKVQFQIGKHDADKKKLYVKVDDWPRINTVDDAVLKLVERPALAYRGRSIFDLAGKDLEQIEVQRGDEKFALKKADGKWRLSAPVDAEADGSKVNNLAGDLTGLNVIEYVTEDAKEEDLDKLYGLAKPALTVTLRPAGADAKPLTLRIGKQRDNKQEYFAKLESSPQVFVVRKDIRDQLDQPSLALRPLTLWQVPPGDLAALRIQKQEEPEYSLKREGTSWKIAGPFDASVGQELMRPLLVNLGTLKVEKYETHAAKELDKFGLDKPYLRAVVRESDKDKEAGKEHVLLVGKPTGEGAKTRFAKLGNSEAIVVVGEPLVNAVDRGALDMLDRTLLKLTNETITQIKSTNGETTLTLEKKDDKWQADAPAAKFQADKRMVNGVLAAWFTLNAERFAAYGPKTDPAKYGLDKPSQFVTITLQPPTEEGKPAPKSVEHVLALGKTVEGGKDERYAQLDKGPGIVVLGPSVVTEMTRPYLDFVDHTLLDIDSKAIAAVARKMGTQELELAKKDDGWQIVKPEAHHADGPTLEKLASQLSRLRAERIAAFPAKDLKMFGLDDPAAVLTLKVTDGDKTKEHVIKVGETADKPGQTTGDRYVLVEGTDKVAVLPGTLVRTLVAKPLVFRDRALAKFADADKIMLERGPRKAVFARIDGNWKLTEPLESEADQTDLEDFINSLARLRADELVAEKPEELKSYGLDRPEARWRLFAGDKEVLGLLIGQPEKVKGAEPARRYAKLASNDVVFLLDAKLSGRALGEYRNRKLWDAIDASQVVRLEYGGDSHKPFTLEMVDNTWHVMGKPEAKVNTGAINDTLATLASLRTERFVVDKGADPKLYGLEPPQLTIELRTRTGTKRQLHIGGREGESKRYYARLPEGARSDVFVLSEADAAKIIRDLAAFLDKEEKPKP